VSEINAFLGLVISQFRLSESRQAYALSLIGVNCKVCVPCKAEATVNQWIIDYGLSGQPSESNFKQYLWTLGLRNLDGTEKLALQRMRDELQSRSWIN
jgi:hypothetical protein